MRVMAVGIILIRKIGIKGIFCIFANRMSRGIFRHIASIVLLATYLPMVVLSSVHVHHDTIDAKDECSQCAGHIEKAHHHEHDCLYCHLLNMEYEGEAGEMRAATLPAAENMVSATCEGVETHVYGVALLRAPPRG